jgi:hypothetical protein
MKNLTGTALLPSDNVEERQKKTWELKPETVYGIYTSVVRPILTYAALLWWQKASQISVNRNTAHL